MKDEMIKFFNYQKSYGDAEEAFLATGDSRETSRSVMEAILFVAKESGKDPVQIWETPTDEEVHQVWWFSTLGMDKADIGLYWGEDSLHTKKLYAE